MEPRILLLDDDPKFRAVAVLAANEFGFAVNQTTSIKEAELELTVGKFDLLVIDGNLPDGDGLSFIAKLRRQGINTDIVFISAHLKDSKCFSTLTNELGVRMVLPKPVSLRVLAGEFQRLLDPGSQIDNLVDIDREFAALALEYERDLPGKVAELSESIDSLFHNPKDLGLQSESTRQAHILSGNAGTYGFADFGKQMRQVENLLVAYTSQARIFPDRIAFRKLAAAQKVVADTALDLAALLLRRQSLRQRNGLTNVPLERKRGFPCVLLLDHDTAFIHRVESLLSADGTLVYSLKDTVQALNVADKLRPDVIMIDSAIYEDTGRAFCLELMTLPWFEEKTSVIACVSGEPSDLVSNQSTCIKRFLNKSISNIKLLDELGSLIRSGGSLVPRENGALSVK